MRLLTAILPALFLTLALALPAQARPLEVFGRTLQLPLLPGYCELDQAQPLERLLIDNMLVTNAGTNELVSYYAVCQDVEALRAGGIEGLSYSGATLVPLMNGAFMPVPGPRAAVLDSIAAEIPKLDPGTLQEIEGAINDRSAIATLEDVRFLGLVERDEHAIYLGLLMMVVSNDGTRQPMATIVAMTKLQDVVLTVNLTRPYESSEDIEALMTLLRPHMAELVAANP